MRFASPVVASAVNGRMPGQGPADRVQTAGCDPHHHGGVDLQPEPPRVHHDVGAQRTGRGEAGQSTADGGLRQPGARGDGSGGQAGVLVQAADQRRVGGVERLGDRGRGGAPPGREAGATVTDTVGAPWRAGADGILVAPPALHARLLELLRDNSAARQVS